MTTTKTFLTLVILEYLVGLFACCESRKEPDSKYELRNRITDHANILTTEQEDSLIVIIKELELKIGSQLAILTIPNLDEESIEELSFKTAEASGLGRTKYNDGVLITIAFADRQMRIEVGTGLENILNEDIAAKIISEDMAPKFAEQKFDSGLYIAIKKIGKLIEDNQAKVGQEPVSK